MKVSASASASFCIDVEPASEIVPESFLSASAVFVVSCSVCCVDAAFEPVVVPSVALFPAVLLLQPVTIIIDIAAHATIAAHFLNKFFLISLPLSSRNTAYILFHIFSFLFHKRSCVSCAYHRFTSRLQSAVYYPCVKSPIIRM